MNHSLNDVQSQLNPCVVNQIFTPNSIGEIQDVICLSATTKRPISVAGHMHSMGGQQFCDQALHIDMRGFNRVLRFDRKQGLIEVESGIDWPTLIHFLTTEQHHENNSWGIRQKQTGVDHVTLAGSLSSNIHGRGLNLPPIVNDVDSFTLIDSNGKLIRCSRAENSELFSLAIGGYGLFGIITHVTLRLSPRVKVMRCVEAIAVRELLQKIKQPISSGALYGDCQYSIHVEDGDFPHPGIFSYYIPVPDSTEIKSDQMHLAEEEWGALYKLARVDKQQAFEKYTD